MDLRGVMVVEDAPGDGDGDFTSVPATAQVGNRPIAHHVLEALQAAGAREIVVASSARSAGAVRECIEDCRPRGTDLEFVEQSAPMEFTSALKAAAPLVDDAACIVHVAGGLLAEPLVSLAESLDEGPDAVLMVHQTPAPNERLSAAALSVLRLAELDPRRSSLGVAGVWAFGPGVIRHAAAGPVGDLDGITQMAERITSSGGTIHVRLADAWRAYRGNAVDLLELNRIVLDRLEADVHRFASEGNQIEGRVWIHEGATVRNSVIVGPTVIGDGAHVSDAYIGPYTSIGTGARVEGAEIERSIIASGASVVHVGDRLVASVVGRNARVFRDFALPRALRLRVGEGTEVALC
jgi:glucose-1-phosphate thymidylyltransferase